MEKRGLQSSRSTVQLNLDLVNDLWDMQRRCVFVFSMERIGPCGRGLTMQQGWLCAFESAYSRCQDWTLKRALAPVCMPRQVRLAVGSQVLSRHVIAPQRTVALSWQAVRLAALLALGCLKEVWMFIACCKTVVQCRSTAFPRPRAVGVEPSLGARLPPAGSALSCVFMYT